MAENNIQEQLISMEQCGKLIGAAVASALKEYDNDDDNNNE